MPCSRRPSAGSGRSPSCSGRSCIGTVLASPLALVLDPPDWSERSLVLAPLVGILTVLGFQAGFMSFRDGAVSVVAPIIACEGGVAAVFSLPVASRSTGSSCSACRSLSWASCSSRAARGRAAAQAWCPLSAAALIWGGVLALSAPVAHDLGAGWAFLLVRGSAVDRDAPGRTGGRRAPRSRHRVVAGRDLGRLRRDRLLRVRAGRGARAGRRGGRPRRPVRHGRCDRGGGLLRRAPAPAADRGHRHCRRSPSG